ncbi:MULTISPECIES: glycosyltransferase family 2 protein [unclassified Streptomyces]|uniref:glycosyltransferase n=1 Tax=unclassified Streptomyces TaxID=2593676 RepID=UPI0032D5733C
MIVPAYNESAGIEAAVRSLVASDHPVEVIVVDDGSTDGTAGLVESLGLPYVRVIRQRNAGKPAALNTGIAAASYALLVMVDGDTVLEPEAVRMLVQPFADHRIGAVSGNAKVINRGGLLGRRQHIEYVVGFNLDRRLFDLAECMPTVRGAVGAFRHDALLRVGGVSEDTLAEDTDLTMALCRDGWRVVYQEDAIAWTEAPASLCALWRQRYRWCFGTLQAMWKHRGALIQSRAAGKLGRRGLVYLLLFQVLLPLLAPVVDIYARLRPGLPGPGPRPRPVARLPAAPGRYGGVRLPSRRRRGRSAVEPASAAVRLPAADVPRRLPVRRHRHRGWRLRWQRVERYGSLQGPAPTKNAAPATPATAGGPAPDLAESWLHDAHAASGAGDVRYLRGGITPGLYEGPGQYESGTTAPWDGGTGY